jgi:polyisoprenoid-binding protein YceI
MEKILRNISSILISLLLTTTVSLPALAAWKLDNENSQLSFMSVKKGNIAENHSFSKLAGNITEQAQVNISVDLSSVNTNIAIRDERMKEFVFKTDTYSTANFTATLETSLLKSLILGEDKKLTISGVLDFHGEQQTIMLDVSVIKLSADKILVNTIKPFFIQADAYGVVAGINKLKELASLPSINYVVPVSFSVTFTR